MICMILYDINYCSSCSCYAATLYVKCGPIYSLCACAPAGLRVPLKVSTTERPPRLGAYGLKSTGSRESSARVRFEIYGQNVVCCRTVRLCRYCAWTRCGTFPQVYRGTGTLLVNVGRLLWAYRISVDVVAHRWMSSRGVLLRRGRSCSRRTISSTIPRSFVKRQRKRPGHTVSPDRLVPFHLISVAEREHAVRTVHRVICHRTSSRSEFVVPRWKILLRC